MNINEARLYLEHTSIDDFNLEEHQKQNRYEAIQVLLKTIDKAIEYIEKQEDYFNEYPLINRKELLDILKGSDKE